MGMDADYSMKIQIHSYAVKRPRTANSAARFTALRVLPMPAQWRVHRP
jgi:hypothetical protein